MSRCDDSHDDMMMYGQKLLFVNMSSPASPAFSLHGRAEGVLHMDPGEGEHVNVDLAWARGWHSPYGALMEFTSCWVRLHCIITPSTGPDT